MSIKVMSWVWEHGPLNGTERMLLLALADHCDDAGHGFPSMIGLAAKACVTERGARQIMRRLEADGWVRTQIGGGRGGKSQYQILIVNPERQTGNEKPGMTEPNPERDAGFSIINPERGDLKPGTVVPPNLKRTIKEKKEREDSRACALESARDFEAFWALYPRKVGKEAAKKAWLRASRIAPVEDIATGLAGFVAANRGADLQFIAHPATWLNQGRWQDDQSHARNGPRSSTEDLQHLSRISPTEDLANLFRAPLKAITQ